MFQRIGVHVVPNEVSQLINARTEGVWVKHFFQDKGIDAPIDITDLINLKRPYDKRPVVRRRIPKNGHIHELAGIQPKPESTERFVHVPWQMDQLVNILPMLEKVVMPGSEIGIQTNEKIVHSDELQPLNELKAASQ